MAFDKLGLFKNVVSGVVGIGAGRIVKQIIKTHTNPETLADKTTMIAGTWVISGIVTTAAKKYTDEAIDQTVGSFMKGVDWYKTSQKLDRINAGESTFEKEGLDQSRFRKNDDGKWTRISEEDWKNNNSERDQPTEIVRKLGDN